MSQIVTLQNQGTIAEQQQGALNAALAWLWGVVNTEQGAREGIDPAFAAEYNARLEALAHAGSGLVAEIAVYQRVMQMLNDQLTEMTMQRDYLAIEASSPQTTIKKALDAVVRLIATEQEVSEQDARYYLQALIGEGHDIPHFHRDSITENIEDVARFCAIEDGDPRFLEDGEE